MRYQPIMALILALILLCSSNALHLSKHNSAQSDELELQYLIGLQQNYKSEVNDLQSKIKQTETLLKNTTNLKEQISILESAIIDERKRVGEISYELIPDPKAAELPCHVLSAEEQASYGEKVKNLRNQMKQLQELTDLVPECDEIEAIRRQIEMLQKNVELLQSQVDNDCEQHIIKEEVIFQTNLYNNSNWILGGMKMDELIDEFYQRNLQFANISNCPLETPFYAHEDPTIGVSKCVVCSSAQPYFNMKLKNCMSCPVDMELSKSKHECQPMPKNSNYQVGENYVLEPLKLLPLPDPQLKYCPETTPFFNGEICVSCVKPENYWNISESKCKPCPESEIFNLNERTCLVKEENKLSIILGTKWVTEDGDVSRVLNERSSVLERNKTLGIYSYCDPLTPYFDGNSCIFCENDAIFNLDTNKCTMAPEGLKYDQNMRKFLTPENGFETDPKAINYITIDPLQDSSLIPNCNQTHPYYDSVACIYCQHPFIIFDVSTLKCSTCDPVQIYNDSTHKCEQRPSIYIEGNEERLMATEQVSIEDYKADLAEKLEEKKQSIPLKCENPQAYANVDSCVVCSEGEYFNVETRNCMMCDGTIDPDTQMCHLRTYYITNPEIGTNFILPPGTSLQDLQEKADAQIQGSSQLQYCPLQTPISNKERTECSACPPDLNLYNYSSSTCTTCPSEQRYDQRVFKCRHIKYLTDLTDNILLTEPHTLSEYLEKEAEMNKTEVTEKCPKDAPYTNNYKICFPCDSLTPLYDIETGICTNCKVPLIYDSATSYCKMIYYLTDLSAERLIEKENYTIETVGEKQQGIRESNESYVDCPPEKPYGELTGCFACNDQNSYFNLMTKKCSLCPDNTKYIPEEHACVEFHHYPNLLNYSWITNDGDADKVIEKALKLKEVENATECASFYNFETKQCVECTESEYYNYDSLQCEECPSGTVFDINIHVCSAKVEEGMFYTNIEESYSKNLIYGGLTIGELEGTQEELKEEYPNSQFCPPQKPYFDKIKCIECPKYKKLFNIRYQLCQVCLFDQTLDTKEHNCMDENGVPVWRKPKGSLVYPFLFGEKQ